MPLHYYYLVVPGMVPRAPCMLGKYSAAELHLQLKLFLQSKVPSILPVRCPKELILFFTEIISEVKSTKTNEFFYHRLISIYFSQILKGLVSNVCIFFSFSQSWNSIIFGLYKQVGSWPYIKKASSCLEERQSEMWNGNPSNCRMWKTKASISILKQYTGQKDTL